MKNKISHISYNNKKFIIFFSRFIFLMICIGINYNFNKIQNIKDYFKVLSISYYKKYIRDCYKLKKYERKNIRNKLPYFCICLPTYNMEKYIRSTILSIMKQSFQDYEIVIVNDYSNDNTLNIINEIKNSKIKIINHSKNLGLYASRVDCIINSSGKYIILMDPDDLLLNPNLLESLYNYNLGHNLDIIEFTKFNYLEKKKYLYENKYNNHYHNFSNTIINQPQLSDLLFYIPNKDKYSKIICRFSGNKIFRKEILLKTVNFIGKDYYKEFFITADDTLINIISFQFANNYSNINYPGYMYNIREKSMTHGKKKVFDYNYLLFNKKLY